jgi:hypothetical protein
MRRPTILNNILQKRPQQVAHGKKDAGLIM